ncbi:MAG: hypothetical protein SVY53_10235 [Chloroflexota bacterium]|nr:hypothetical protein [Chloroflexota bacterium]
MVIKRRTQLWQALYQDEIASPTVRNDTVTFNVGPESISPVVFALPTMCQHSSTRKDRSLP